MSLFDPAPMAAVDSAPADVVHVLADSTYRVEGKNKTPTGPCLGQRAVCGASGVPGVDGWRTAWVTWATCPACLAAADG